MQASYLQKFVVPALLMATIGELNPLPVRAAYDQPTTWSDLSDFDLSSALRSQYSSPENLLQPNILPSALDVAISDADSLVRTEFRVPKELRNPVRFWLRVYTEFTTQHVVIFDSRHTEVIYEVLDFRDFAKIAKSPIHYELTVQKRVKSATNRYRKALTYLAKHPTATKLPDGREHEILAIRKATSGLRHKHSLGELSKQVRSQTGQRDNIVKGLLAAEAFLPKMEELFRQLDAPVELTRLPLVESSFNLHAKSRVGASGVWQFMPQIGKKFLVIDSSTQVDERLSPLKATAAAGNMLNESFQRFKSWPLSITAYNHGLRGLPRGKSRREGQDFNRIAYLFDPCDHRSPLGWAARNYYAEFLAVLHAEAYRKMFYGEPPIPKLRPMVYRKLDKPIQPLAYAKELGLTTGDFRLLNPDIQNPSKYLPKGFLVAVPSMSESDDMAKLIHNGRRRGQFKKRIKLASRN